MNASRHHSRSTENARGHPLRCSGPYLAFTDLLMKIGLTKWIGAHINSQYLDNNRAHSRQRAQGSELLIKHMKSEEKSMNTVIISVRD